MGTPNATTGESKFAFETKFKGPTGNGNNHEVGLKSDGSSNYELKSKILEVIIDSKFILFKLEIHKD